MSQQARQASIHPSTLRTAQDEIQLRRPTTRVFVLRQLLQQTQERILVIRTPARRRRLPIQTRPGATPFQVRETQAGHPEHRVVATATVGMSAGRRQGRERVRGREGRIRQGRGRIEHAVLKRVLVRGKRLIRGVAAQRAAGRHQRRFGVGVGRVRVAVREFQVEVFPARG